MTNTEALAPRHSYPVTSTEVMASGWVGVMRRDTVVMPGGSLAPREVVEHRGAVAVAALDDQDRIMLVLQYRHPVGERVWAVPAGLLDVAGEDPYVTACRELVEEAGVKADNWAVLADTLSSPGFTDESVRVYLATGLRQVERPALADDEESDLEAHWVPLADAVRMVFDGTIVSGNTIAAVLGAFAWLSDSSLRARPTDAPWRNRPTAYAARKF